MTATSIPRQAPLVVPLPSRGRVLLVEDKAALRAAYARILQEGGFSVQQACEGLEATEALRRENFDAVLTDIMMPGMNGNELLRVVREHELDLPVILITGNPTVESAVDALEHGALRYLIKPVANKDLLEAVARAVKLRRLAAVKRESVAYLSSAEKLATERTQLGAHLRAALETLWMAYQPIVDWQQRKVVAFEALVRTTEPTLPDPSALFSLAEQLKAVPDVSRAIRASVARCLIDHPTPLDVFVNLHPSDLLDDELFLSSDPLSRFANQIVLEVTEREALAESAGIFARASRLRKLGFRLAIDDLGAGYAGLKYFALLTPDVVKIDLSLVRHIDREQIKQKLVGSLISLCKELGMKVIAEGIETVEERDAVVALGCNLLQGHLFARPGQPFPEITW